MRWRTLAAAVFIAVAVAGMAASLKGHLTEISALLRSGTVLAGVGAAVAVMAASAVVAMFAWRDVLIALGTRLDVRTSVGIYFVTVAAAYLPGPFWPAVAGVHLGRRTGVTAGRMATAYVLSIVVYLISAAPVAALLVPFASKVNPVAVLVPIAAGLILWWRPDLVATLATAAARLLRREPPQVAPADQAKLRRAMLLQTAAWLVSGVHLWLLAICLGAPPLRALPVCVGAFAFAATTGALAVFTPDGVGVRELAMTGVLTLVLPLPQAAAAALASRLVCVLSDGSGALAGWLTTRYRERTSE